MAPRCSSRISDKLESNTPKTVNKSNHADLIAALTELDKGWKIEWNRMYEAYENNSANESISVQDISRVLETSAFITNCMERNKMKMGRIKPNKSFSNKHVMSVVNHPRWKYRSFLYTWTSATEIKNYFAKLTMSKVRFGRLVKLVEVTFESKLKEQLVLREEARYLCDEAFPEYDKTVRAEAEGLRYYIGKKYVVMYILLHKCNISQDEITRKIERQHNGVLHKYLPMAVEEEVSSIRIRNKQQKKFVTEWNRLKQFVPVDYLVAYCDMLENKIRTQKCQTKVN